MVGVPESPRTGGITWHGWRRADLAGGSCSTQGLPGAREEEQYERFHGCGVRSAARGGRGRVTCRRADGWARHRSGGHRFPAGRRRARLRGGRVCGGVGWGGGGGGGKHGGGRARGG